MSRNVRRLPALVADIIQAPVGSAERRGAFEELITMAMKADTFDLLDDSGDIPVALSYHNLEGEPETHGNQEDQDHHR